MDKERYNQIIDELYGNYISYIHDIVQGEHQIYGNWYGKKEFIDKIKTDTEFSEKWGLKIDERELSLKERMNLCREKLNDTDDGEILLPSDIEYQMNKAWNIPTKLITLEYNNEKTYCYE